VLSRAVGNKIYILGVDPGTSGALCIMAPAANVLTKVWPFPVTEHFGHKVIDYGVLAVQILPYVGEISHAIIEDVHSMPLQGVASTFSFGVSKGVILGMIAAHGIKIYTPPPAIWKNVMGVTKDKDTSRAKATQLYPGYANLWAKKKDDGIAEAVLLAEFGKRFLEKLNYERNATA
jgi:crossover junction endodeoxyribonuclease RuvC